MTASKKLRARQVNARDRRQEKDLPIDLNEIYINLDLPGPKTFTWRMILGALIPSWRWDVTPVFFVAVFCLGLWYFQEYAPVAIGAVNAKSSTHQAVQVGTAIPSALYTVNLQDGSEISDRFDLGSDFDSLDLGVSFISTPQTHPACTATTANEPLTISASLASSTVVDCTSLQVQLLHQPGQWRIDVWQAEITPNIIFTLGTCRLQATRSRGSKDIALETTELAHLLQLAIDQAHKGYCYASGILQCDFEGKQSLDWKVSAPDTK